ncbi:MAG: BrnT family toxin [Blastocatellia bacterium]
MKFDWHPLKAKRNIKDHGVSFEEASTVFDDPLSINTPDFAHSIEEQRFLCFGTSEQGVLLVVSFTERGETIRIITAREMEPKERKYYEQGD